MTGGKISKGLAVVVVVGLVVVLVNPGSVGSTLSVCAITNPGSVGS